MGAQRADGDTTVIEGYRVYYGDERQGEVDSRCVIDSGSLKASSLARCESNPERPRDFRERTGGVRTSTTLTHSKYIGAQRFRCAQN
jgi:hypothetical protein